MSKLSHSTRLNREKMLSDPYRQGYTSPDGNTYPCGPNGAYFADGRNHLMYPQCFDIGELNGEEQIAVKNGVSFRLRTEITPNAAGSVTVRVRADRNLTEYTDITVDFTANKLIAVTAHNAAIGMRTREEAPFSLAVGEKLSLDIFVDESFIEVYANERQAICCRTCPSASQAATNVFIISDGADFGCVNTWEMMPANMY